MHDSQVYDTSECGKFIQKPAKFGLQAGESKLRADYGDAMRLTSSSTNVFSEMATLESIPTWSSGGLLEEPLQDDPENAILSDDYVPIRQPAPMWQGRTSRTAQVNALQQRNSPTTSPIFKLRRLPMPETLQEEKSEAAPMAIEAAPMAIEEDEIEFERGCVYFASFHEPCKPSDADFGFSGSLGTPALDLPDNPSLEELSESAILPSNDVPARQATWRGASQDDPEKGILWDEYAPVRQPAPMWQGRTSRSAKANALQRDAPTSAPIYNHRKLLMPRTRQEEKSEVSQAAIKEDEEFERRCVQFDFCDETCKQSDADVGFIDSYDEAIFFSSDDALLDGQTVPRAAPSKLSTSEKFSATHLTSNRSLSLVEGSNVLVGAPGRALHKRRTAASSV